MGIHCKLQFVLCSLLCMDALFVIVVVFLFFRSLLWSDFTVSCLDCLGFRCVPMGMTYYGATAWRRRQRRTLSWLWWVDSPFHLFFLGSDFPFPSCSVFSIFFPFFNRFFKIKVCHMSKLDWAMVWCHHHPNGTEVLSEREGNKWIFSSLIW